MEFKILAKDFWDKTHELYGSETRHVKEMHDKHFKLGLKYKDTNYLAKNSIHIGFVFEVIDEKKFILAKLKYGF